MNKHDLEEDFPLSGGEEPDDKINVTMVVITALVILTILIISLYQHFK
jgi:hypothetical protein